MHAHIGAVELLKAELPAAAGGQRAKVDRAVFFRRLARPVQQEKWVGGMPRLHAAMLDNPPPNRQPLPLRLELLRPRAGNAG